MTSYKGIVVTCGACGQEIEFNILTSLRIEFGPDLDCRYPEYDFSTMRTWVQRCRRCNYCAEDISKFDERYREVMKGTPYQSALADSRLPRLPQSFVCKGVLDKACDRLDDAGLAYLHAAWVLDDHRYDELARHWRGRAADLFLAVLAKGGTFAEDGASELVLADCLRRAGRGAEALPMIEAALSRDGDEKVREGLAFERKLIATGDLARYRLSAAGERKS